MKAIHSLGFRGEALSSIAAVSKVELITKTADTLTGTRVVLEGAAERAFDEVGAPDGTTFMMRNLFFNTPVRRKFLKQPATEGGYIADLMEHLALSRPDISFKFVLGNQNRFHTSGNGDLKETIYRIYGREISTNLVPIQAEKNGMRIEGYLGKPTIVRSNRNFEIYYINGRFIRSSVIARAIEEGYKEYLMQHKFPLCVLHITMDSEEVDVNVHPTKMDVRFSDNLAFVKLLSEAIRDVLKHNEMIPDISLDDDVEIKKAALAAAKEAMKLHTPEPFELQRGKEYRVMEESNYHAQNPDIRQSAKEFAVNPVWNRVMQKNEEEQGIEGGVVSHSTSPVAEQAPRKDDFFVEEKPVVDENPGVDPNPTVDEKTVVNTPEEEKNVGGASQTVGEQMNLFEERIISVENRMKYRIIGQVFDTYWILQYENKMLMIDQHAAHEKVKYERFMKHYREKTVATQGLLPPIIVTLTGQEETVLKQNWDTFAALGFEIESFGGAEYALRGVPTDLYGCGEREMFIEVLDELCEGKWGTIRVIDEKIASMSCKAAVKGNNRLSLQEVEELIDELLTLDNPYNCPHGRPTIVTISQYEMEKMFKRIV